MKYLILLALFFTSCKAAKKPGGNDLSILVSRDSLISYNGTLEKKTRVQRMLYAKKNVTDLLEANKKKYGEQLRIMIKVANEAAVGENAQFVKDESLERGFQTVNVVDGNSNDSIFLNFRGINWSMLDKNPTSLDLTMPKPEKGRVAPEKANFICVVLLSRDDWWCYIDTHVSKGKIYDQATFQSFLVEKKKKFGDDVFVFIKPTENTTTRMTEDLFSILTKLGITDYTKSRLLQKERDILNSSLGLVAPEKVIAATSETIETVPQSENSFNIEVRADNSIWYQPISPLSRIAPQQVKKPITENLGKIIRDYEAANAALKKVYIIKGHGSSSYNIFEQIVTALKANNIFTYQLQAIPE